MYAIGLPFQRTRKSAFIDGVGADARVLTKCIAIRLGQQRKPEYDSSCSSVVAV
jgi:hypothetical protein